MVSLRKVVRGMSARVIWAATRSSAFAAAMPASSSPERRGEAFASRVRRSAKECFAPRTVWL